MRLRHIYLLAITVIALLAAGQAPVSAAPPPGALNHVPACPGPAPVGTARCHAQRRTDVHGLVNGVPAGYGPTDLQSAYSLAAAAAVLPAVAPIVAIVDAFDDPNAESDLAIYRSLPLYGLTPCTTANGCFSKVNQSGGATPPAANGGWAEEISLDLDMVSAICPNCHILLVEATSNSFANLGAAVNYAATVHGVVAISNSYGGNEFRSEANYEAPYDHPGIAVTVSSGDGGYGVEFPAASRYVTAVGGTSLSTSLSTAANTRGWNETVWSGAGSGCSGYIPKPLWQTDTGCSRRTVADVAAVADPYTGVAVYDAYSDSAGSGSGWMEFGGTSVASPIIASVYALAGNTAKFNYGSYPYLPNQRSSLFDVTSGSNGSCRRVPYLCTGESGYDGPTGLGSPNGTGGF